MTFISARSVHGGPVGHNFQAIYSAHLNMEDVLHHPKTKIFLLV